MRHRISGTNGWGWQGVGPTKILWRMSFWCATEMLYFCGTSGQVRHRIIFCGALLASAPQKYIPPIRVFLLVGYAGPYGASLHGALAGTAPYAATTHVGHAAPMVWSRIASREVLPHTVPPSILCRRHWHKHGLPHPTTPRPPTEWVFDSGTIAHLSKDADILHSLSS
jgi:hypothetical protein